MINLLPEQHKQQLLSKERFRLTVVLGALGIAFFVCLSLLFLAIRIYVSGQLQLQDILIQAQQQKYEDEQSPAARIRGLNEEINQLSDFYARQALASEVLAEVAAALPQTTHLTSFAYNAGSGRQPGKISLAGFAQTTEDLLMLRTALEANPAFSNFFFPPSNWVHATDITFSFTFEYEK